MMLEDGGYEAICVNTGRDALRVFAAHSADKTSNWRPDLVLLDLRLPDMSGVEVVRELQKNQPSIPPVIFLSADSPQILRNVASSVGAAAIRKPFNFDDLYRAIEGELCKRRGSGRRRRR